MKYNIRKAEVADIESIYSILKVYSVQGVILERSKDELNKNVEKFFVAEDNNTIAGVISYYDYSDILIEVRSLAVRNEHFKKGIGSALLKAVLAFLSNNYKGARIFALTYHPDFFRKYMFHEVSKESLPEKIWKDCKYCMNRENCGETALVFSGNNK
jgi:amino-acid N-acetyltransferase